MCCVLCMHLLKCLLYRKVKTNYHSFSPSAETLVAHSRHDGVSRPTKQSGSCDFWIVAMNSLDRWGFGIGKRGRKGLLSCLEITFLILYKLYSYIFFAWVPDQKDAQLEWNVRAGVWWWFKTLGAGIRILLVESNQRMVGKLYKNVCLVCDYGQNKQTLYMV